MTYLTFREKEVKRMNKNALKSYAIWARVQLIDSVKQKAFEYGINENNFGDENATIVNDKVLSKAEVTQRAELIKEIKHKGFNQVVEEVAYTWFNRFIALRYMEVNGYLPTRVRVFTNEDNAFDPEIMKLATSIDLDGLNKEVVFDLIDEQDNDALFKYLIITQCNALNPLLPAMFEQISNYTELLFPNNLLREDSVIGRMITDIPEEDWTEQVQIIGWLYQYYISEKHNEIIDIKGGKAVEKNDVPAATQLFTTDWVVRYMVDNSLGKYWIERNPNSPLKDKLEYYIETENVVDEKVNPEELTVFDPCMGSGHILVYAFDVLMQIYLECGYNERDVAKSIVENNLYGIDIDDRAYQLAYFAVMMKARSYSRRILTQNVKCNLCSIQESNEFSEDCLELFGHSKSFAKSVVNEFIDAKEYGSILNIKTQPAYLCSLEKQLDEILNTKYDNFFDEISKKKLRTNFVPLLKQAIVLSKKYVSVVTNPPYLNKYDAKLKKYIFDNYEDYKGDLFSVFMYHNFDFCIQNGYSAFMTPNVWMFIKSYEELRKYILDQKSISSLVQIAKGSFYKEATVDVCTFVLKNSNEDNGTYIRLEGFKGDMDYQKNKFLESIAEPNCEYIYNSSKKNFSKIPGSPIAFWASEMMIRAFSSNSKFGGDTKKGVLTGNNDIYLRLWHEVNIKKTGFNLKSHNDMIQSKKKWFPVTSGGFKRKWYGNFDTIVNLENDGFDIRQNVKNYRLRDSKYYMREAVTWTEVSSGIFTCRYVPEGVLFGNGGPVSFFDNDDLYYHLGLLNSNAVMSIMTYLAPTVNFGPEQISKIPLLVKNKDTVERVVKENVELSKQDWDSFETSWDFLRHPLVENCFYAKKNHPNENDTPATSIQSAYSMWYVTTEDRFTTLKNNEEELNRTFIDIYGLQDELTPDVEDKDVTVRKADLERDIKSLLSYAVGCIFGRYSLDVDGLAYAGGEWDNGKYSTFIPDSDNIIPISDDEYFEDDLTNKVIEFIKVVYGEETLEENLSFIASALGGKGTSRDIIRNYFLNDFYKDHLKIYQKRPIYWLFDSGKKNGFKALIYMHRYQSDLLARMRTDYVFEQQERYRTQIDNLTVEYDRATGASQTKIGKQIDKIKNQLHEIGIFEEKVHHLADQMIDIDLDDGVKVNYAKFEEILAKLK
jgi:hypothetical protein